MMALESKISIGNIFTVASVVVGLIITGSMGTAQFRDRIDRAEAGIGELKTQCVRQDLVNANNAMLLRSIEDLRGRLERIERKLDRDYAIAQAHAK